MDIDSFNDVDSKIAQISKPVRVLKYIEPINLSGEREAFFSGKRNPEFKYGEVAYDSKKVAEELSGLDIPGGEIGAIYQREREINELNNCIVRNLGDSEVIRSATAQLYGVPNEDLVNYAGQLLREIPQEEAVKNVSSSRVKSSLEAMLHGYGLDDWRVELSDKRMTSTDSRDKRISVCKDRLFSESDIERLGVHEIGVHVLRAVNGGAQPLKIFGFGLPGYLPTEEGLAGYAEQQTGNTNPETMRDYAARVIAVDSVCKNLDFRQTFDRLKDYKLSDEQAWGLAVRAHRGGGFIKDHVYLQGMGDVGDFVRGGGDLNMLFVGKVGINDLPLVGDLLDKGILKGAEHKPQFN